MRALVITSLTCFPLWSLWISVGPIIHYITGDSVLAKATGEYTSYFCFGYPAFAFCKLANGFLQSQNIVFTILFILVAGNVMNILMQYVLTVIVPLGIKGVAIAYAISLNVTSVIIFGYLRFTAFHVDNFSGLYVEYFPVGCTFSVMQCLVWGNYYLICYLRGLFLSLLLGSLLEINNNSRSLEY